MIFFFHIFLSLICLWGLCEAEISPISNSRVAYPLNGGRFGDNLINYMHAKWISYKYQIPLLYSSFPYSDQLQMHSIEVPFNDSWFNNVDTVLNIKNETSLDLNDPRSFLYVVYYFPESRSEWKRYKDQTCFEVDWENIGFRQVLKQTVKPLQNYPKIEIPERKISVAVHVRLGGGLDKAEEFRLWPLKFPSISFYIDQIKNLAQLYQGKSLYIYLFTDDKYPLRLKKKFQKAIPNKNIMFDCHEMEIGPNRIVLEDFFALTQFDCLIRPESNYSIAAEKITEYKVVISPVRHHFINKQAIIDHVQIQYRDKKLKRKIEEVFKNQSIQYLQKKK